MEFNDNGRQAKKKKYRDSGKGLGKTWEHWDTTNTERINIEH